MSKKKSFHFQDKLFFVNNKFLHSDNYLSATLRISILKLFFILFVDTYTEVFYLYDSEGVIKFLTFSNDFILFIP